MLTPTCGTTRSSATCSATPRVVPFVRPSLSRPGDPGMSPHVVIRGHASIGPLGADRATADASPAKAYVRDAMPSTRTSLRPGTSCAISIDRIGGVGPWAGGAR